MKYSHHASLLVPVLFVLVSMVGISGCTDTLLAPNDAHYTNTSENFGFAEDETKKEEIAAEEHAPAGEVDGPIVSDPPAAPRARPSGSGEHRGETRAKKIIRRY